MQYLLKWRKDAINNMIEKAILEANEKGVKVLSLGLMNQVKKHASTDLVLHWCEMSFHNIKTVVGWNRGRS